MLLGMGLPPPLWNTYTLISSSFSTNIAVRICLALGSSDNGAEEHEERLFLIEYDLWGQNTYD